MMFSSRLCAVGALLLILSLCTQCSTSSSAGLPRILDNVNKTYTLFDDEGKVCLYASFDMTFLIIYATESGNETDVKSKDFQLPPNDKVDVGGECNKSLDLRWTNENGTDLGLFMNFTQDKNNHWTIKRVGFSFVMDNNSFTEPLDMDTRLVYRTSHTETNLLNRTFSLNQYFYCDRCKTYNLVEHGEGSDDKYALSQPCTNSSKPKCSMVEMSKAVIFPGNIQKQGIKKLICIEDYIALQEIIVPVVVGGILSFLLVVIFISYTIAYFRRRRKESRQYEPMSGDV